MQHVWIRATGPVPDDRADAIGGARLSLRHDAARHLDLRAWPRIFDPDLQVASLDHAMWFHRPHRLDDWLLYAQDSPSRIRRARLHARPIYAEDGTLVASVAQEGLIRLSAACQQIGKFSICTII